jgi:hypothetical protein
MSDHALLSPSASERWLRCTPSARLEEKLPAVSSRYADEGTLAHEWGAMKLFKHFDLISSVQEYFQIGRIHSSKYWTIEMSHNVQDYVEFCKAVYEKHQAKKGGAMAMVEQQFGLSRWVPESFGTSDFNVVANRSLEVVDLKYGQGVAVSARNNSQLMLYALGVYNIARWFYDIDTVNLTIVQPRIDNTNTWSVPISELLDWAETVVKPQAKKAFNGEGDFVPGEHCRFCKAKPTCRALAKYNQEIAHLDFELPDLLSNLEISEVLTKADMYINWLNSVKDYALQQALKGVTYPGFKVVTGRSNRLLIEPRKVELLLRKQGFMSQDFLTEPKLKGIGDLEKLLGKAKFDKLLSKYLIKPKGAPALVRVTDKRLGINSLEQAVEDFENLKLD